MQKPGSRQTFMQVVDRDEAYRRFFSEVQTHPVGVETVELDKAWGRTLAEDVISRVNVPSFDRSNFDGFAILAADVETAREDQPVRLALSPTSVVTGFVPEAELFPGQAMRISTGGMVPRGADAIVLIEHCEVEPEHVAIKSPVGPGHGLSTAGSDIAIGERVLTQGERLSSRETGVLAAIGQAEVRVWRRPKVAVISTGDELIPPGQSMEPGRVYDSNARILADAIRECGGLPLKLGIAVDDWEALRTAVEQGLSQADLVLLSGGTSKGEGDLCYRIVAELTDPGIIVHGVALKPGKPICLAATRGKPVVVLPGFPTSAIFTFHEFVAPLIRLWAGIPELRRTQAHAELAQRLNSQIGRTEFTLVGLVPRPQTGASEAAPYLAYPMGKGSGSVTTFSHADGFIKVDREVEQLPAGERVDVQLLGDALALPDLVVIGSQCPGCDFLISLLRQRGLRVKSFAVGSVAGLRAAREGRCDVAGIHLLDPQTQTYNEPFLNDRVRLCAGYGRLQGLLVRKEWLKSKPREPRAVLDDLLSDPQCRLVNRNAGSGTRALVDRLLQGQRPPGYSYQVHHHPAVAAAIEQGRADWGVAIQSVCPASCAFIPLETERFDFVIPKDRWEREPVRAFRELLMESDVQQGLRNLGFQVN